MQKMLQQNLIWKRKVGEKEEACVTELFSEIKSGEVCESLE